MRNFKKISDEQWRKDAGDKSYVINLPKRATSSSAGYDISAPIDVTIPAQGQAMIPTGLKVQMEPDDVLLIIIRSSLGIKKGLSIINQTGVIDSDYYNNETNEGHIWIGLKNNTDNDVEIKQGDRIAQGLFIKYNVVDYDEPIMDLRKGGIGSTN